MKCVFVLQSTKRQRFSKQASAFAAISLRVLRAFCRRAGTQVGYGKVPMGSPPGVCPGRTWTNQEVATHTGESLRNGMQVPAEVPL